MNSILLILLMVGIGALIGGVTNSLAIKMLFRPYKALYIGNLRLPFTPGLIPKRQKELAQQLGKMVVNHLLTPEGIRRKIAHPKFKEQLTMWAKDEVRHMMKNERTIEHLLKEFQMDFTAQSVKKNIAEWIEERYHNEMDQYRAMEIGELLSPDLRVKADRSVDAAADHIQKSVESYFRSSEGREKVSALIDNYLDNQGFFGNMISSFMGPDGLTERIYPIILKYVSDREMNDWLQTMLHSEKDKLLKQPVSLIEGYLGKDEIGRKLGEAVSNMVPVEEWMTRTVAEWTSPYEDKIINHFVPGVVHKISALVSTKIESMMANMHLSEIVQEEVEAFQVERLEEMVLGISKREFKMITYLGALLGGMIGLLQAVIVLFFG